MMNRIGFCMIRVKVGFAYFVTCLFRDWFVCEVFLWSSTMCVCFFMYIYKRTYVCTCLLYLLESIRFFVCMFECQYLSMSYYVTREIDRSMCWLELLTRALLVCLHTFFLVQFRWTMKQLRSCPSSIRFWCV